MGLSSKSKKYNFKNFSFTSIITLLFILIEPAHAYAGPGVALGALIVFITALVFFALAICVFLIEINISTKALRTHLEDLEDLDENY